MKEEKTALNFHFIKNTIESQKINFFCYVKMHYYVHILSKINYRSKSFFFPTLKIHDTKCLLN